MKKILVAVLAALALVGFTACGGGTDTTEGFDARGYVTDSTLSEWEFLTPDQETKVVQTWGELKDIAADCQGYPTPDACPDLTNETDLYQVVYKVTLDAIENPDKALSDSLDHAFWDVYDLYREVV